MKGKSAKRSARQRRAEREKVYEAYFEEWKKANPAKKENFTNESKFKWWKWGPPAFINDWFEGSEPHHMEKQLVIHIPAQLHRSAHHALVKGKNMRKINGLAMGWFDGLV